MQLTIESLAYGGAGVARSPEGITVFVEGVAPGDTVEADVFEKHPRYWLARIAAVLEPSPARVEPPCPYFGTCGGCQWQHVGPDVQRAAKSTAIADALARIGGLEAQVAPTVPSPAEYGYRNKVELTVVQSARGPVLGFARHRSADVVPVEECLLLPERSRRSPRALSGALRYVASRAQTAIDRVALRVATTGDVSVDLWTAPGPFPRQLAAKVMSDAVGAKTVTRVLAKGPTAARRIVGVEVLGGRGAWGEVLGDDRYLVSAPSFFQANTKATESLRRHVRDAVASTAPASVADVYAGVGTFTLPLARIAPTAAIESSSHALADLRRNLHSAELDADVLPGDAEHGLAEVEGVEAIVVDPPRSGLGRAAGQALAHAHPERIIYVSCDPTTLARDLAVLVEHGYALGDVTPFDLFPQTYHVETVAELTRRS